MKSPLTILAPILPYQRSRFHAYLKYTCIRVVKVYIFNTHSKPETLFLIPLFRLSNVIDIRETSQLRTYRGQFGIYNLHRKIICRHGTNCLYQTLLQFGKQIFTKKSILIFEKPRQPISYMKHFTSDASFYYRWQLSRLKSFVLQNFLIKPSNIGHARG